MSAARGTTQRYGARRPGHADLEALPGMRAIAGGTFDDPNWRELNRHVWTLSAQKWVTIPHGVEQFDKGSLPPPE